MSASTIDYPGLEGSLGFQRADPPTEIIHGQGANVVTNAHVEHSFGFGFDISPTLRTWHLLSYKTEIRARRGRIPCLQQLDSPEIH